MNYLKYHQSYNLKYNGIGVGCFGVGRNHSSVLHKTKNFQQNYQAYNFAIFPIILPIISSWSIFSNSDPVYLSLVMR